MLGTRIQHASYNTSEGRTVTDKVDTDALRDKAIWLLHVDEKFAQTVITAAADEIDRLRADLKASAAMHEQARALAQSTMIERDRLRAMISDAPHVRRCRVWNPLPSKPVACTCWKADML
jgi:uncharacterized small protein (DUF1192 family)